MADTGTNLTVSDPDALSGAAETENKSGFMDTLGSADMMRQMALVVVLVICVAIAVFIMIWAQEPDYRPLAKMETEELIQTLDYLENQTTHVDKHKKRKIAEFKH